MAFVEKVVKVEKIVKVENDEFDFDHLISFRTTNFVGEWNGNQNEFIIFHKKYGKYIEHMIDTICADTLEDLVDEVKDCVGEEIIEVYDRNIISISIDV